jgi:hypothetical protein
MFNFIWFSIAHNGSSMQKFRAKLWCVRALNIRDDAVDVDLDCQLFARPTEISIIHVFVTQICIFEL